MPDERLDTWLARETGLSRSRVERLIREGYATVNGRTESKPGFALRPMDMATLHIPPPIESTVKPEPLPLSILYEDSYMAVVNKPVGMVVHPAVGNANGTLVNALLFHLKDLSGIGGTLRPGIVHRLDKETSGLLLVAKTNEAHQRLSDALKARKIVKTYRAVALGYFKEETGAIEAPIARHPIDRKRMAVVRDGRYARTEYQVLDTLRGATLLDVNLITGRTHQIRVHFAYLGHPLLGDPVYGGQKAQKAASRLMLHAWRIALTHPITNIPLAFEAPEPPEFLQTIKKLLP